jgi:hypothetical protein
MRPRLLAALAVLALPTLVRAQVIVPASAPVQPAAPAGAVAITLPEGTEFVARTRQAMSSRTSATGDEVPMEVAQDVVVNGFTVIRAGTIVRGSVGEARRAGRIGRGGSLSISVEATTAVDGQRIRLRSAKTREGNNATGSTVALTVLFGPLGLLKRGHDAEYPVGTNLTVYTDSPLTVYFAQQAAPAPAAVQQQPAAPVVVQQQPAAPVVVQQQSAAPVVVQQPAPAQP